jgi:NAD+ diphosphatase
MAPAPGTIAFAGGTLDRAAHLRDDGGADRLRELGSARAVLVGDGQEVAISGDGGPLALVPVGDLPSDARPGLTFLGLEPSGAPLFAFDARAPWFDAPVGATFVPLRGLGEQLSPGEASVAAYAVGMIGWHRVARYCGRSGDATVVEAAGHRRRCPVCGLTQFPRTDPAITMLVQTGDRCLLSRRHGAPANRWSALAGFVEPGETPEAAVIREAREETGVEVVSVRYVASQPWPFPQALMIGFWAFVEPAAVDEPLTPAPGELVEARWWARDELSRALEAAEIILPPAGTIGNFLISTWLGRAATTV